MKIAYFNFNTPDQAYFCAVQSTAGAGALLLNGTGAILNSVYPQPIQVKGGFGYVISLTSASNNSGVNFVVTGTDSLNNTIVETIQGPNANTVQSVNFFNTLISVVPNGAVSNVSVGTGVSAASDWFIPNTYVTPFNVGLRISAIQQSVNYTVQTTDYPINSHTPSGPVPSNRIDPSPDTNVVNATTNQYSELGAPIGGFNSGPVHGVRCLVNTSQGGAQSLVFSISQAGVKS